MTTRAQQFDFIAGGIMVDGAPITTGYVKFLAAGTSNTKNAYEDKEKAVAITKKALDAQGRATVYGDGLYKLEFYVGDPDASGVLSFSLDNIKCTAVIGKIHTITTNTTIDRDTQLVLVDTTSGNITVTLDPVANFDNEVTIKKISSSNTVTVDPDGSETIDSDSTKTMTSNNAVLRIYPDTTSSIWRSSEFLWDDATISINGTLDIGSSTTTRVAPAGTFVSNSNGNANVSDTLFDIDANITTWESVGPTGSGATNIWTALDSVPTDADWVEIKFGDCLCRQTSGTPESLYYAQLYARKNGSSEATGDDNTIASANAIADAAGNCASSMSANGRMIIPVASVVFDLQFNTAFATLDINILLIGWGFNP